MKKLAQSESLNSKRWNNARIRSFSVLRLLARVQNKRSEACFRSAIYHCHLSPIDL